MGKFDALLSKNVTMKERWAWMFYLGMVFFLLYGSANQYAFLTAPHASVVFDWEKNIPFVEAFIVPYMLSDFMFVWAFLLVSTRVGLRVLALRVLAIVTFSVLIFFLFPLAFSFEKPKAEIFTFLFYLLQADLPFNQAPSLHVSFAVILWYAMASEINSWLLKMLLACWFGVIVLSTLLVYQHHFIDIPTGALVGFLAVYSISEKKSKKIVEGFTTFGSLKIAIYFMLGALLLMLLAFNVSVFFVYLSLCLFLVSLVYAFGLDI